MRRERCVREQSDEITNPSSLQHPAQQFKDEPKKRESEREESEESERDLFVAFVWRFLCLSDFSVFVSLRFLSHLDLSVFLFLCSLFFLSLGFS